MTYETLEDLERFAGRLTAEQVARDFVAVKRAHVRRLREAIDATVDNFYKELPDGD